MSKANDVFKVLCETGEPDQDYDHEFYNAICKKLKKAGFDCSHKEFDKYQSVYILVRGYGKFWTKESYYTGIKKGEGTTFTYEQGTETEHVFLQPEDNDTEIEVTRQGDKVDVKELLAYLRDKPSSNWFFRIC
jgi:hypothetical protein